VICSILSGTGSRELLVSLPPSRLEVNERIIGNTFFLLLWLGVAGGEKNSGRKIRMNAVDGVDGIVPE